MQCVNAVISHCFPPGASDAAWEVQGGAQLEPALRSGAIALLDAYWLAWQLPDGVPIKRRQDLPSEAFLSIEQLKAATRPNEHLPIIVLSNAWLQIGHPDPEAQNLRLIRVALRAWATRSSHGQLGVFWDFGSLHQPAPDGSRTTAESKLFHEARQAIADFYAHGHTTVFRLTRLPKEFSVDCAPPGANTTPFMQRGWCFAETAWAELIKPRNLSLDLGLLEDGSPSSRQYIESVGGGTRAPPMLPEDFVQALVGRSFSDGANDRPLVVQLQRAAFEAHMGAVTDLDFSRMGWGDAEARQLVRLAHSDSLYHLTELDVSANIFGDGTLVLAQAVCTIGSLTSVNLLANQFNVTTAALLVKLKEETPALVTMCGLHPHHTKVSFQDWNLRPADAQLLAPEMLSSQSLTSIGLLANNFDEPTVAMLLRLKQSKPTLVSLCGLRRGQRDADFQGWGLTQTDARLLAPEVAASRSLMYINLRDNQLGAAGSAVIAQGIATSRSVASVNLGHNCIGPEGGEAIAQAIASSGSLISVNLSYNELGDVGCRAISEAITVSRSLTSIDLAGNDLSVEASALLATSLMAKRRSRSAIGERPERPERLARLERPSLSAPRKLAFDTTPRPTPPRLASPQAGRAHYDPLGRSVIDHQRGRQVVPPHQSPRPPRPRGARGSTDFDTRSPPELR